MREKISHPLQIPCFENWEYVENTHDILGLDVGALLRLIYIQMFQQIMCFCCSIRYEISLLYQCNMFKMGIKLFVNSNKFDIKSLQNWSKVQNNKWVFEPLRCQCIELAAAICLAPPQFFSLFPLLACLTSAFAVLGYLHGHIQQCTGVLGVCNEQRQLWLGHEKQE